MTLTKRLQTSIRQLLVLSFLLGSTSHCTQQAVEKKAAGPCRIKQIDEKATVRQANKTLEETTDQTIYEYDGQGRISRVARHYEKRLAGQSAVVYSYAENTSYVYDDAGFLTAQSSDAHWSPSDGPTSTNTRTSQYTYAYTNGRLTQQINRQTNPYGLQTRTASTYKYDATGSLTTRTDETTYPVIPASAPEKPASATGSTAEWTYQNGKTIDYVERQGGVDVHPYAFQNGFLQTQTGANYRSVFTYDSQGHRIKQEFWVNDQLHSYTDYTYAQAQLPPGLPPGNFNGFPTVVNIAGVPGVMSASTHYDTFSTGPLMKASNSQVQLKLTNAGYVQSSDQVTTTYQNAAGTVLSQLTSTTTYTLDGSCD
ncbi:hypothetical protein [Fibrella forsythiae]|uniref:RHS repeat protein n=1 Tax=Fibrella forsythiae TaxID=2817061 RepID=A0ABS3JQ14_9BACT|nr:hypothetical protein [Fibrella forsythiae]MBO0952091.1 hypothetical protein [Fibrella forsythiae]